MRERRFGNDFGDHSYSIQGSFTFMTIRVCLFLDNDTVAGNDLPLKFTIALCNYMDYHRLQV